MIFISSAKPFGNPEIDHNQQLALESWDRVVSQIVYFNFPIDSLTTPKVTFIEAEEYPEIFRMVHLASLQIDFVAILNADIQISSELPRVVDQMEKRGIKAATSYRWQFKDNPADIKVIDNGLDFFIALPEVWEDVGKKIPHDLRIGSQLWDTWMLSYLATFQTQHYADLTPAKVVIHPVHGDRRYGPQPKEPQLWSFPVMSPCRIT